MRHVQRVLVRPLVMHICNLILAIGILAAASVVRGQDVYQIKVVTDRADAIYEVGDTAKFLVTVTKDKQPLAGYRVTYVVDDFITEFPPASDFPQGELEPGDDPIEVTSARPGFLRCRATFETPDRKKLQATAGAAFAPTEIQPSLPVPDDFDDFWKQQKAQLAEVAPDAKLVPVDQSNADLECFDVQVNCLGGAPVSGYLAKPKAAEPRSLPAILWVHGAGVRGSSLPNAVQGAKAGMLSMDINAHGLPNGKPAKFYQAQNSGPLKNYRHAGRESRETSYFRGMYLRLVRAIDFLTSQPEWDGRTVAVFGHSQGGGQALVAGGLDPRVTFVATGVPAICDHSGRAAGRINGWPKLVPTGSDGKPAEAILEASRYVDAVNFASRCRADAIMSVGFIDLTCPPSSCYAAYNVLQGRKQVVNEPLMGHAAPQHIRDAFFQQVQEHVRANNARANSDAGE